MVWLRTERLRKDSIMTDGSDQLLTGHTMRKKVIITGTGTGIPETATQAIQDLTSLTSQDGALKKMNILFQYILPEEFMDLTGMKKLPQNAPRELWCMEAL